MASSPVVKLWNDKRECEMYDNFVDLYAIIKTMEKFEKDYFRVLVSSSDYESECLKLIVMFKPLTSSLRDAVPYVDGFANAYWMDYPIALNRLLISSIPATVKHMTATSFSPSSASTVAVAEYVQHFITTMDSVKLNMTYFKSAALP